MSGIALTITQPAHGAAYSGAVALVGSATGDTAGLSFKWFSSLNAAATAEHPEINVADHTAACLGGTFSALAEFGSHVVVLAATDRDGIDSASIQAVRRSALAGGAPLVAPVPCVVHQVGGAAIHTPAVNDLPLPKTRATVAVLTPGAWLMPDPDHAGLWIANAAYQALNGVALRLRLTPDGAPDPDPPAEIPLALDGLPPGSFFRDGDKTWLRWTGDLPGNLGTGRHVLSLIASAGPVSAAVTRYVML